MATEVVTRTVLTEPSLPEVHASVSISRSPFYWRRLVGFLGPGFLISVGYMDPGNWATDIAGGSRFGYTLLFVIMASNLMAILLQSLSLKLGVATDRDLAQLCHESYGPRVSFALWIMAEIAIAACDLAEVIGSAIALELLFHIPLFYGVLITGVDVLLILLLQRWGFRYVEALVIVLIGTIIALFGVQMLLSRPEYWPVLRNLLVPSPSIVTNPAMLYIAIGILGATVMPHNLYLHSSIVQSRRYKRTPEGKREAIHLANVDSALALMIALFVNAAILIVAAAVFHRRGLFNVAAIQDAYKLLSPMVGAAGASTLFAIALLASGQNSSHHRHARRAGGDGGFRPHPRFAVAPPAHYPLAGDYSHHHRGRPHRRAGNREAAHPQPGDSFLPVELRGGSAGDVHRQPHAHGRVCQRQLALQKLRHTAAGSSVT
jgi:manganese transport protein